MNYFIEDNRGISHARNRLVKESKNADFLAFIDDDETAEPQWLDELLSLMKQTDADAIHCLHRCHESGCSSL